jgi:hypothetical protein
MSINVLYPNFTDIFIVTLENKPHPVPTLTGFLTSARYRESMPCEFPRASGHLLHHGMTNQNGQGQVLGGQAPSDSSRLGAKQGHF